MKIPALPRNRQRNFTTFRLWYHVTLPQKNHNQRRMLTREHPNPQHQPQTQTRKTPTWIDIGETTTSRTGTPGYIPVEFLWMPGEAGPENDVFSFGVLMLEVVVRRELWENNMFAHSVSQVTSSQVKSSQAKPCRVNLQ